MNDEEKTDLQEKKAETKETGLPKEVTEAIQRGVKIFELTGEDDEKYYLRKPGKSDINRYLAGAAQGKLANATTNLVYDLAIHPSRDELERQFKEMPGRMVALNNSVQTAIGMNEGYTVKKL